MFRSCSRKVFLKRCLPITALLLAVSINGCTSQPPPEADSSKTPPTVSGAATPADKKVNGNAAKTAKAGGHAPHDHSGWWCNEHGVPEEVCGQCNSKLAAEFQKKKDWRREHDRPDSQCFVCHPELESQFAAQFEAKYGKPPPKPVN